MSDEQEPVPAEEGGKEPFAIVPTLQWGIEIEQRLAALEQRPAAAGLTPEQEARVFEALRGVDGRLSRHRDEIETIKEHQNELGEYVERRLPAVPAGGGPL